MAKKPEKPSINDVFTTGPRQQARQVKHRCYAVRMSRGPRGANYHPLVIIAHDPGDARRQWFNHHGLNEETYRYALDAVRLEEDHPLCSEAITCPSPQAGGSPTVEQLARSAFEDQERMLKDGEAKVVETM